MPSPSRPTARRLPAEETATGGNLASAAPSEVRLWDIATGKLLWTVEGEQGVVRGLAFAPDGKTLVYCDDVAVGVIDVQTGRTRARPDEDEAVTPTTGAGNPRRRSHRRSLDGRHAPGLEQSHPDGGAGAESDCRPLARLDCRPVQGGIAFMKRMTRGIIGLVPGVGGSGPRCGVTAAEPASDEPRKPQVPELKVEKYTLPNGLTVILHEDHKTPVVAVNVLYKVGSKDEKPGRTGFAHLFEHMMFQGSKNHDTDYFRPLEKLGAELNGTTDEDQTNYYETVPSNALELALWLEADRMGFLLPAMTQEKLDNQRDVVKNERRQTVDNVPYGQAEEVLLEALYPADHPYHHSVIGSMADLSAARLADVAAFFRTYYVPNNAILCVAGDFQPAQAKTVDREVLRPAAARAGGHAARSRACRACRRRSTSD